MQLIKGLCKPIKEANQVMVQELPEEVEGKED